MKVLQTKDLKKYYGNGESLVKALDGVNLSVDRGEFVAIVGTSGSGKSTLLHMLGGLDYPTEGSVFVDGKDISGLKEDALCIFRRRKIGFVFQSYNLVPVLNVYENIVLPIELRRAMEIEDGSPLEIYVEEDSIILKACKPVCIFCGSDQGVEEFKGRCVCASCRGELREEQ